MMAMEGMKIAINWNEEKGNGGYDNFDNRE
jgi:hypothetical protein